MKVALSSGVNGNGPDVTRTWSPGVTVFASTSHWKDTGTADTRPSTVRVRTCMVCAPGISPEACHRCPLVVATTAPSRVNSKALVR